MEREDDPREVLSRSKQLLQDHRDIVESEELLEKLPQGHGSGLNADTVDGMHAAEILAKAPGKGGGGSGSGSGDMTKAVYDPNYDGRVVDSDNLQGKTLFEVQDHIPKSHGNESHSSAFALDSDLDTVASELASHESASAPHSGHEQTGNKGAANGYCDLDSDSQVPTNRIPTAKIKTTLTFAVTGSLTVGTDKAPTLLAPCSLTITSVRLVVKTAPTDADLQVDVNKNDTSIFSSHGDLKIAAGQTTGNAVPTTTSLALDDKVTVDIVQVGSTIAGSDLTIEIVADQTVGFS